MNSADSQVVSSAGPNATSRTDASSDTPAAQRDGNRKQCLSLNVTDIIRTEALPLFRQLAGRGDAMKKLPGTPGCFRTGPCRRWAAAAPSGAPGRGWRAGVAAGAPLGAAPPERPRVRRGVAVEAAARLAGRGAASATRPRQGRRRPSPLQDRENQSQRDRRQGKAADFGTTDFWAARFGSAHFRAALILLTTEQCPEISRAGRRCPTSLWVAATPAGVG